ncbi:MAG: alcohol dehydrogenase catalytic domain-containing protein [Novosphingobium sp.]|uniref:zinc-binding dehydrogenase n=1 Tax=Novosphingobium sp. TaxID=1874826 RepID=UPI0027327CC1|nr:alcohol dehydrogenase catalytic domain-containing protein [Novosphingobium sp.]MDP3550779.1 alcohol dehydrogenase catalytic domain-containing protein [Novosphingobium sp.]
MQGVVITGERTVSLQTFADPAPGHGEAVIAICAAGVCGTDLHRFRAAADPVAGPPVIAGHEPAGIVVAVGRGVPPQLAREGMRVMVHHYEGCTACADCRAGWTQMCSSGAMKLHGRDAHGAFAPFMKVPAYTLLPLDERLSFAAGAAIGCGTGTAWGALDRMGLNGRHTIVIFGQGPVGLSATMLAAAQGARVIALDVQPARLEAARAAGAWHALNAGDPGAMAQIRDLTAGQGAPMVLETSGSQPAADAALEIAGTWATVCFVGVGARVDFDVYARLRKQLTVLTSWTMSSIGQKDCADFVIEHGLDLDALFTDRWPLASAQQAFERFDRQTGGKAVFLPG